MTALEPVRPAEAELIDIGDDLTGMGEVDVSDLVDELAELARANPDPVVLMAGRFAMYPMEDGGVMFVTDCSSGLLSMQGVKRTRIPPAMLRATSVLVSGGSKARALRAALFGGRHKPRPAVDGR